MSTALRVLWYDGRQVGTLASQKGALYFAYDSGWIATGHNLSPIALPFSAQVFAGQTIEGLPGLLHDCLPDAWGQRVARRELQKLGVSDSSPFHLLAWRGTRGLGAMSFVPALEVDRSSAILTKVNAAALARGAREIERDLPSKVLPQLAQGGTAGGAWPKAVVLQYEDGTLRVAPPDGLGRPSILKFDFTTTGVKARTEYVFNLMAEKAGVNVARSGLIEEGGSSGKAHFISRRFDVLPGKADGRVHFHSLSGMLHKESNALDYADFFRAGLRLGFGVEVFEQIARRMIFNLLSSNHDDHGKNHAFAYDESNRKWNLTPAFDLTFTEGYLDRGMTIAQEIWPKFDAVASMCEDVGIKEEKTREIYDDCHSALALWPKYARKFEIPSDHTKQVAERFTRISEACGPVQSVRRSRRTEL